MNEFTNLFTLFSALSDCCRLGFSFFENRTAFALHWHWCRVEDEMGLCYQRRAVELIFKSIHAIFNIVNLYPGSMFIASMYLANI